MKQLVTAAFMYVQDHDERLFGHYAGTRSPRVAGQPAWPWPAPYYTWVQQVYPYVRNEAMFICPSATPLFQFDVSDWITSRYLGYGMNYEMTYFYRYLTLADLERPSQTLWFSDCAFFVVYPAFYTFTWPANATYGLDGFARLDTRHNEGANVGFADGHAKWMSRSVLEGDRGRGADARHWWP